MMADVVSPCPLQVLLRWGVQRGTSVIPKSTKQQRLRSNLELFDWQLQQEDFDKLNQLPLQVSGLPAWSAASENSLS